MGAAMMEISVGVSRKSEHKSATWLSYNVPGHTTKEFCASYRDTCSSCLLLLCSQTSIKWKQLDVQQQMNDRMVHFTT